MKPIHISEDILPVGKFKAHASSVLKKLRESGRPVVITLNGKPAAVLVLPEEFDLFREHQRFMQAVHQGLADSEAGRVIEDEQMGSELEEEFGELQEP